MSVVLIFDTETTDRKEGEIIEAAWLRLEAFADLRGYDFDRIPERLHIDHLSCHRYLPSKAITTGAMAVHHILPSDLVGAPASSSFELPADTAYIIGHSIDFDWEAARRPSVKRIDTHAMAQWVWPQATGYSLVALIYMLLGPTPATRETVKGAHGALADTHLCLTLLRAVLEQRPLLTTWSGLWAFSEECRIPRTAPLKRWEGVLLEDMDAGAIYWCLDQHWLDPYFRKGLERVLEKRQQPTRPSRRFDEDDDDRDEVEDIES